uniref:Uncharacterized protein n=1 Tax=Helianthus annuus TaxID=4232 RepID=A0A251UMT1_HELAN
MTTLLSKNATSLLVLNGDLTFHHLILLWMTLMMIANVIGFVVKCLPSDDKSDHNNGKDEKKTTFILEDLRYILIYIYIYLLLLIYFSHFLYILQLSS